MNVILLETIRGLGKLGDTVNVKPGYARNHLIPYEKAVPATPENVEKFEARRAELEKVEAEAKAVAEKRAVPLEGLEITLVRKVQDEGKLFGSVTIRDIIDALAEKGIEVEKKEIDLPASIHTAGEYDVAIRLHDAVAPHIKVTVIAEEKEAEAE